MLKNDLNWLASGVAAAVLLPALAAIGVPFILAAIIAIVAFAGLVVLLAPRKLFEGIDVAAVGRDKVAFAQDLLSEAMPAAERLGTAARSIESAGVKSKVLHLAEIARDVIGKVEANPGTAPSVRRFMTYYLPRSAEIAEGYATLAEKRQPDPKKLDEVSAVIGRLEEAFVHYADTLTDQELGSLDIDLKLVQTSLKEDLGR